MKSNFKDRVYNYFRKKPNTEIPTIIPVALLIGINLTLLFFPIYANGIITGQHIEEDYFDPFSEKIANIYSEGFYRTHENGVTLHENINNIFISTILGYIIIAIPYVIIVSIISLFLKSSKWVIYKLIRKYERGKKR